MVQNCSVSVPVTSSDVKGRRKYKSTPVYCYKIRCLTYVQDAVNVFPIDKQMVKERKEEGHRTVHLSRDHLVETGLSDSFCGLLQLQSRFLVSFGRGSVRVPRLEGRSRPTGRMKV